VSTQVKFLLGAALFTVPTALVYWFISREEAGFAMLLFMGLAVAFFGGYVLHRGRRHRIYVEDDPDADHSAQAGQHIGWFSGGSVWPLVMGIGAAIGLEGFVFGAWLLFFGAAMFVWAAIGLMMESRG
jgi:Cytochrome c oxidase subunit IV